MASGVLSHNTAQADLTLTKTASPDLVEVCEQMTYTLVVTNNGPATSTNATLEDNPARLGDLRLRNGYVGHMQPVIRHRHLCTG